MRITTTRLGLAAYIKLQEPKALKDKQDGKYIFESEKTGQEWRLSYANSQFSKYNAELIELRNL